VLDRKVIYNLHATSHIQER